MKFYLLCIVNGALLSAAGIHFTNWMFWPLAAMVPLAYLTGEKDNDTN